MTDDIEKRPRLCYSLSLITLKDSTLGSILLLLLLLLLYSEVPSLPQAQRCQQPKGNLRA